MGDVDRELSSALSEKDEKNDQSDGDRSLMNSGSSRAEKNNVFDAQDYSELFRERAKHIKVILSGTQLPTHEDEIELLTLELASAEFRESFEQTYRLIYGSQLEAMSAAQLGSVFDLSKYHQQHLERTKHIDSGLASTFELWLQFLTGSGLLEYINGVGSLTPAGKLFLYFIDLRNYSLQKAF